MDPEQLRILLNEVAAGRRSADDAFTKLLDLPYEEVKDDLDSPYARLDHHRALRTGVPEVIFGQGKTPQQVASIVDHFVSHSGRAIATRVSLEAVSLVSAKYPDAHFFEIARILTVGNFPVNTHGPFVAVASGGTADMPVAEEAAITIELLGTHADRVYDVGVAGLHRLLDKLNVLREAQAIIAVAGMEGALPTVVGGLVACPVIAVPTSVGYGASFHGLAALLTMLNSCVPGVAVVNIDNGFGAGAIAHMITQGHNNKVIIDP
jgi:pyridinium-3,5-biscarboxylic acid mononucleotide synthase